MIESFMGCSAAHPIGETTMSSELHRVFDLVFQNQETRVVDLNGDAWLVGRDVCKVLGLSDPTKTLSRLPDEYKEMVRIKDRMGRSQQVNIVSESGLYYLAQASRKPIAKKMWKVVCDEVLPQIRKKGYYGTKPQIEAIHDMVSNPKAALKMIMVAFEELEKKDAELAAASKDIEFANDYRNARGAHSLTTIGKCLGLRPNKWIANVLF